MLGTVHPFEISFTRHDVRITMRRAETFAPLAECVRRRFAALRNLPPGAGLIKVGRAGA